MLLKTNIYSPTLFKTKNYFLTRCLQKQFLGNALVDKGIGGVFLRRRINILTYISFSSRLLNICKAKNDEIFELSKVTCCKNRSTQFITKYKNCGNSEV